MCKFTPSAKNSLLSFLIVRLYPSEIQQIRRFVDVVFFNNADNYKRWSFKLTPAHIEWANNAFGADVVWRDATFTSFLKLAHQTYYCSYKDEFCFTSCIIKIVYRQIEGYIEVLDGIHLGLRETQGIAGKELREVFLFIEISPWESNVGAIAMWKRGARVGEVRGQVMDLCIAANHSGASYLINYWTWR